MPFDRQKYVASIDRVARHAKLAGQGFKVLAFGALVLAAVLARFAPKASIALAAVFTCALALRWFAQRGAERLSAMTDRGDVDALRAEPAKFPERYVALVALALFDGPGAVTAIDHTFCACGEPACAIDGFDADLEVLLAALRRVESGLSWKDAAKIVLEADTERGTGVAADSVAMIRMQVRLAVLRYMLFRSGVPEPTKKLDDPLHGIGGYGRVLRAPLLYAAASHAKRRGDVAVARALLAKLAPWKPGSRLAGERAKLERVIAVVPSQNEVR